MIANLITEIKKELESYNSKIQAPCSKGDLKKLQYYTLEKFNYKLPDSYISLLEITNGIFYNGIEIYASDTQLSINKSDVIIDGLIDMNEKWRDDSDKKNYIIFAESGDDLYAHNLQTNRYQYVDRITLEMIEEYKTFEELLALALNHILDNY